MTRAPTDSCAQGSPCAQGWLTGGGRPGPIVCVWTGQFTLFRLPGHPGPGWNYRRGQCPAVVTLGSSCPGRPGCPHSHGVLLRLQPQLIPGRGSDSGRAGLKEGSTLSESLFPTPAWRPHHQHQGFQARRNGDHAYPTPGVPLAARRSDAPQLALKEKGERSMSQGGIRGRCTPVTGAKGRRSPCRSARSGTRPAALLSGATIAVASLWA